MRDAQEKNEDGFRAAYFNYLKQKYDALNIGEAASSRAILLDQITTYWYTSAYTWFRDRFAPKYQLVGRGLELGAGLALHSGLIELFYPQARMAAIDVSPTNAALSQLIKRGIGVGPGEFMVSRAESLPFGDGQFDFIFSSACLHHFKDVDAVLAEVRRVMAPGASWYVINEPSMGALPRWYFTSRIGEQGAVARAYGIREKNYSYQTWVSFFDRAGFQISGLAFERAAQYKQNGLLKTLYYTLAERLPDAVFRLGFPTELSLVAQRRSA